MTLMDDRTEVVPISETELSVGPIAVAHTDGSPIHGALVFRTEGDPWAPNEIDLQELHRDMQSAIAMDFPVLQPPEIRGDATLRGIEQDLLDYVQAMEAAAEVRQAARRANLWRQTYHSPGFYDMYEEDPDSVCWCSPSRGMLFYDRYQGMATEQDLTLTYHRWDPTPEPEPSRELVVLPKPVLDPVEVIPAPNYFRRGVLRMATLVTVAMAALSFGQLIGGLIR